MKDEKYVIAQSILLQYIKQMVQEKKLTVQNLAKNTGFDESNIRRMLSGKYSPSLINFMKILDAADLFLFISEKDSKQDIVKLMNERHSRPSQQN